MIATTAFPFLAINELIREKLDLLPERKTLLILPDKKELVCDYVLGVELRFEGRYGLLGAYVLPGNSTPMLGTTPMQLLNLRIDPLLQKLVTDPIPLIKI